MTRHWRSSSQIDSLFGRNGMTSGPTSAFPTITRLRLDAILKNHPHGFRSIPVVARLHGQEWTTALFRYQDGSWSLPVKAAIRRQHHLEVGDEAQVHLRTVTT